MGLAAGQARLLTITGRKSDCEFQSMRLSHQKIALARELADISNEYQNSLNQTKLIYDYYGTGDTSMQLSYGILMNPSALNDYMPTTITDALGRVVLNSRYAKAAEAAGIPQEGLGTLPSENLRNAFIQSLAGSGIITDSLAKTIQGLPYNQQAGFGGGATVAINTAQGNYNAFVEMLKSNNGTAFNLQTFIVTEKGKDTSGDDAKFKWGVIVDNERYTDTNKSEAPQMNLSDLLNDTKQYYMDYESPDGEQTPVFGLSFMQQRLGESDGFIDWLVDEFSAVLDLGDGYTAKALEYAESQIRNIYVDAAPEARDHWINHALAMNWNFEDDDCRWYSTNAGKEGWPDVSDYMDAIGYNPSNADYLKKYNKEIATASKNYIGYTMMKSPQQGCHVDSNDQSTAGVNLNNIAKAFLTYFADYMNGISKTDTYGKEVFSVEKGKLTASQLAPNNQTYQYVWKVGFEVSSDDLGQATFYDALFNQICANGWTENNQVDDNEYLQHMLQNGMMYISKMKDDGYYYQGNFATDTYIKEVADESKIAYAESKYNTQKAKLNSKEQTIDLKMKNLDTEITSLTTEYDTVKSTISKNVETGFKRYA